MEQSKLGKRINEVRKSRGLTADKLSELCNINATYLRQIEGGAKMPSLPVFIDICKALHISPDYLLQDELNENEISKIHEIEMLWKDAPLSKQELALAMIKAALKHPEPGSNRLAALFSPILSVDQILYCKLQILHLAKQPKGQFRQPKGAYEKRDYQQNKAVLRGVCHQDGHAQQGDHRTEQPQHQAGYIDQPHANPDGQRKKKHHRRSHDFQNQL